MHDIVLIEKYSPSSDLWENLIKYNPSPELSVEDIINDYQGFEGELVEFFRVKHRSSKLNDFISHSLELQKLSKCLLLHIISGESIIHPSLEEKAMFMGFDIGACDNERTIYSSIFNEVLFGGFQELINYKKLLNKSLLFPDKITATNYVQIHNEMSSKGKNVEDCFEMTIYEIWKHIE